MDMLLYHFTLMWGFPTCLSLNLHCFLSSKVISFQLDIYADGTTIKFNRYSKVKLVAALKNKLLTGARNVL